VVRDFHNAGFWANCCRIAHQNLQMLGCFQ
jgi:hypothetical protein